MSRCSPYKLIVDAYCIIVLNNLQPVNSCCKSAWSRKKSCNTSIQLPRWEDETVVLRGVLGNSALQIMIPLCTVSQWSLGLLLYRCPRFCRSTSPVKCILNNQSSACRACQLRVLHTRAAMEAALLTTPGGSSMSFHGNTQPVPICAEAICATKQDSMP